MAEWVDSKWYRGCVQQVKNTGDDEERSALVLFIDYGNAAWLQYQR